MKNKPTQNQMKKYQDEKQQQRINKIIIESQQQFKEFQQVSRRENESLKSELENMQKKTQEQNVRQSQEIDELNNTIKEVQVTLQNQFKLSKQTEDQVKGLTVYFKNKQHLKEFSDKNLFYEKTIISKHQL
ncbi:unnamed protein product [Paramecium octaurelia]|uniref:Uncharacterized protein n=1 Tax=Paramecium octaurelia TaxID=43137 RepID=A0A8S1VPQ8_PAROT|nr:unnamed protein product [Paramecium octaurelia]